ncbi:hypothetical protein LG307_03475 [Sutcliffiella horikoshii]|uniref:hypothetical protein n=1 Tax=Sutcliffiella horikoshii TaxID=79883 RepID=UPI003851332A
MEVNTIVYYDCYKKKQKCGCPINFSQGISGSYSLLCGSEPFKIFESDVPTELTFEVTLFEFAQNVDSCELRIRVELHDGNEIVRILLNPNQSATFSESNNTSIYSKQVRRIFIQCLGGTGTSCRGFWNSFIFLRGSNNRSKCGCPVYLQNRNAFSEGNLPTLSGSYSLPCGSEEIIIYGSDETTETIGNISLSTSTAGEDSCDLEVIIQLNCGKTLDFLIPNPNTSPTQTETNSIFYYSPNLENVMIQCLSDGGATGCRGGYTNQLVIRASTLGCE